jgi:hypothetical protein
MQSKKVAVAEPPMARLRGLAARGPADGRTGACARRRAARRLEIDRDHRLVSTGLVREVSRLLVEEPGADPEVLIERMEAALIGQSRRPSAPQQRAHQPPRGARRGVRGQRVSLPAALAVYGHRGNYHGAHVVHGGARSGPGLRSWRSRTVRPGALPAAALAEELHLRCEIWTLECGGAVHVFARPDSAGGQDARQGRGHVMARASRPASGQVELSVV